MDEQGRPLETWQGPNSDAAWQDVLTWADQWEHRQWGVEGTGNYGAGLARHLVAAEETVYEVNPRLTAQGRRRRARKQDKNGRLDAQAVARAVSVTPSNLPVVVAEDTPPAEPGRQPKAEPGFVPDCPNPVETRRGRPDH